MLFLLMFACQVPVVDNTEDQYDVQRPGPDAMVGSDGNYVGGWWSDWTGTINPSDASGPDSALKGWIHLSFQTDNQFIVTNIADLSRAANTSLLVVDQDTGEIHYVTQRYAFGDNVLEVSDDGSELSNPADGSYSRVLDDGTIEFGIFAAPMRLEGTAVPVNPALIQTTRSVPGYGWLQFYGNLEIVSATLDTGDGPVDLPAGTLGTLDRTLGHRSTIQSWNYLSAVGEATNTAGETALISLQMAKDKDDASPKVTALKYGAWVDDDLFKLKDIAFDYDVLDAETGETGDWHISSPEGEDDVLDATFTPNHLRLENTDFLWYVHTDFKQYYGTLQGTLTHDGETWTLDGMTALAEDSLLIL